MLSEVDLKIKELENKMDMLIKYCKDISEKSNDIQIRNHDVQDQIYNLIHQEKTHDVQNKMMMWQIMKKVKEDTIESAKRQFFMDMPKATGNLRKMQLAGSILLSKLDEVCRKNGLNYWLNFGTLIGAIRHEGFIPWDDDTDVGMMRKDVEKLTELLEEDADFFVSHIYAMSKNNMNHCVQLKFRERNTPYCLDIFVYDYCDDISENNIKKQMQLNKDMAMSAQSIRELPVDDKEKERRCRELHEKYLQKSKEEVGISESPKSCMIWAIDNLRCRPFFQGNYRMEDVFPLEELQFEGRRYFVPKNPLQYANAKYRDIYSLPSDMLSHTHFNIDSNREKILNEIVEKHKSRLFQ